MLKNQIVKSNDHHLHTCIGSYLSDLGVFAKRRYGGDSLFRVWVVIVYRCSWFRGGFNSSPTSGLFSLIFSYEVNHMKNISLFVSVILAALVQVMAKVSGKVSVAVAVASGLFWSGFASAQVGIPVTQGLTAGLGVATSGSETGLYEVQSTIASGWGVVVAVVLTVVGFMVIVRLIGRINKG